ncbi:MAG: hypothetical protein R3C15_01115 [Thermoleophilia bacterium]
MASKAEETLRKRKEAKQKKLLLLLVPVLLLLVGLQAPKLLKGDKEAAPTATDTTGTETGAVSTDADPGAGGTPTSGTPITPGATPVTPGTPSAPGVPTGPAVATVEKLADLPDSDQPLDAGEGQLISFSRFTARDPFVQLVTPPEPVEETPDTTPPAEPPAPTEPTPGDTSGGTTDGGDLPSAVQAAVLETNGVKETVPINGVFPSSDPAFRLVGVEDDGKTARIGLVEGSYSSGGETITVKLGETIVLVSQPDGYRYTIEFLNVAADPGTPEPGTTPAS